MKYVFNGFLFSQRQTGVMRYAKEIIRVIDSICEQDEFELVVPIYAKAVPILSKIKVVKYGSTKGNLWEQIDFYKYLRKNGYESINFNNTMPLLKPGIIVIHDVAYKVHPEFANSLHGRISNLYHRLIFRVASKKSKQIVTVSHFSKIQLVENYHIKPNRIKVISNAWQHFNQINCDDTVLTKNHLENKYYFSLGSLSKMKNTRWIFEVAKNNPNTTFVVSGAMPQNSSIALEDMRNVIITGYISDEEIKSLMVNCKAFIYPSIYDGFGIPPMEALSQGARVICSLAACLPEIYRNSVNYIDPYETNVDLDSLLTRGVDAASVILNDYSWEKSGREFYKMIKEQK